MTVFAGQGPVYVGDYDPINGLPQDGYLVNLKSIGCGNRKLVTSFDRKTKEIKESCSGQRGLLAEIETDKTGSVELELVDFDKTMLANALYGTNAAIAAGTVVDELKPTLAVGNSVATKYTGISNVVIKDSAVTPTTLVAGTHYSLSSVAHGMIKILDLGTLVQPLKISYSYAAHGNLTAFTSGAKNKGIIFQGTNTVTQETARVTIPKISFSPAKSFDWLSEEEVALALEGKMLYAQELANDPLFGGYMRIEGTLVS